MTRTFKIVAAINICVLVILFAIWWLNGKDDTWYYITAALIALLSFLNVPFSKKDSDQ